MVSRIPLWYKWFLYRTIWPTSTITPNVVDLGEMAMKRYSTLSIDLELKPYQQMQISHIWDTPL